MSERTPHTVYTLLRRGPQFCGVPVLWFFCFVMGAPSSFFIGKTIGGNWFGFAALALEVSAYGAACLYAQADPALVPMMLLKLRGINFPEETTSYLPKSQVIAWKEDEDE